MNRKQVRLLQALNFSDTLEQQFSILSKIKDWNTNRKVNAKAKQVNKQAENVSKGVNDILNAAMKYSKTQVEGFTPRGDITLWVKFGFNKVISKLKEAYQEHYDYIEGKLDIKLKPTNKNVVILEVNKNNNYLLILQTKCPKATYTTSYNLNTKQIKNTTKS